MEVEVESGESGDLSIELNPSCSIDLSPTYTDEAEDGSHAGVRTNDVDADVQPHNAPTDGDDSKVQSAASQMSRREKLLLAGIASAATLVALGIGLIVAGFGTRDRQQSSASFAASASQSMPTAGGTFAESRTCAGLCLERAAAADCPRDAGTAEGQRLPNCYAETVAEGGFCDGSGECGTRSDVATPANCNVGDNPDSVNTDVYKRIDCALGGSDNGGGGAGPCTGYCFEPVDPNASGCPWLPSQLNKCDKDNLRVGSLCVGDGECGTNQKLDNCGDFDVYRVIDCTDP